VIGKGKSSWFWCNIVNFCSSRPESGLVCLVCAIFLTQRPEPQNRSQFIEAHHANEDAWQHLNEEDESVMESLRNSHEEGSPVKVMGAFT